MTENLSEFQTGLSSDFENSVIGVILFIILLDKTKAQNFYDQV